MKINLTEPTIGKEEENYILKVIRSKKLVDGFYQSKSEKILKKEGFVYFEIRGCSTCMSCLSYTNHAMS